MKHLVIAVAVMVAAAPWAASAQTIYNSQGSSGSSNVQPLNLRALLRGDQGAGQRQYQQPAVPYANNPRFNQGGSFEQRLSALDQWRAERDARAQADTASSAQEMARFSTSTGAVREALLNNAPASAANNPAAAGAAGAPNVPVFYRGRDSDRDGIAKPRRLFNSVE